MNNEYIILNEYVTILKIYDFVDCEYKSIFINTECIDFLKSYNKWYISKESNGYARITSHIKRENSWTKLKLHRVIVDYINSKYNLPKLLDNQEIDHIDGNTFNNLYYPYDDYYNNLRICTTQQNGLNVKCNGYTPIIKNDDKKYRSQIKIQYKNYAKTFSSPQECIDYNNELLSKSFPELAKYYYHHPNNPRNWSWTYSNTVLKAIGFNDDDENINDEDFNEYEE